MNKERFEKIKKEILQTLKKSPFEMENIHAKTVHKWVLKLKQNADELLQLAALAHDIDRAITGIMEKHLKDYSKIDEFKKEHAMRSAQFLSEIMKRHNYSENEINKVRSLVENHEVGGDKEMNILRDADSIAYFEHNIPVYLKHTSRDRTKGKIQFMYKRIPKKIQKIVKDLIYEDKEIEELFLEAISEVK